MTSDKLLSLYKFAYLKEINIYDVDFIRKGANIVDDEVSILINKNLQGFERVKAIAHEMGHIFKDYTTPLSPPYICIKGEERAKNYAAVTLVTYDEYDKILHNPTIYNDWEAAQELGVDIETLQRARRRYELQGLLKY